MLWRLVRLCYKTGKYQTSDQQESKRLAVRSWAYIERAMALGGDKHSSCRRWAGILLSWTSEFEGYKKQIEKSFEIKDHFKVSSYLAYRPVMWTHKPYVLPQCTSYILIYQKGVLNRTSMMVYLLALKGVCIYMQACFCHRCVKVNLHCTAGCHRM